MNNRTRPRSMAALFDWDGTLFPNFTILPWCRFLREHGLFDVLLMDHLSQLFVSYRKSQLTHDELSVQSAAVYASGVRNIEPAVLTKTAHEFTLHPAGQLYPFARPLLRLLQCAEIRNFVISGAPADVLKAYLSAWPIDKVWGLEVYESAGNVCINNRGLLPQKAEVVDMLRRDFSIAFGFGNWISDIPILDAATIPILMDASADSFPSPLKQRLFACTEHNVETIVRQQLVSFQLPS